MILVVTGTERFAFDRLVVAVDGLRGDGRVGDDVFIQLGSCGYEPRHCAFRRFLDFAELSERVAAADMIIAHAGAGTTLLCLEHGKHPILVPRRKCHGEHVDDHQVPFARMMAEAGVAAMVFEVEDLAKTIDAHAPPASPTSTRPNEAALGRYLDGLLDEWHPSG